MRILDLKDLELVAGADPYVWPELPDDVRATMSAAEIDEWNAWQLQLYGTWLTNNEGGDRSEDYEWLAAHGQGVW